MGIRALSRKYVPSSTSSEEYDPETGVCSVDFYFAAKDPFRVAPGNKIPVPWPYASRRASDRAVEIADTLRSDYMKVLSDFGIKPRDTYVRALFADYEQPRDTLVINTHDEDPQSWKEAATVIQGMLDDTIRRQAHGFKISVEIRNDTKMYADVSSTIKHNSLAHQACMQVEQAVFEQVTKSCPGQWRVISYHMRGPPAWETGDQKPTIMVRIAPGAKSFWSFIESQIIAVVESVDSLDIKLHVEILPGFAIPSGSQEVSPSTPLVLRNLPETPVNGSSIGARGAEQAGTLGVWVDFHAAGSVEKQRCFLTCHHVISPGDPANKSFNDQFGIGLYGQQVETPIKIDYPAPSDATATKQLLQKEIALGNDEDGQKAQTINIIDKHVSAGGIGFVIHASGNKDRNKDDRRMDWALVRTHGSSSSQCNKPPAATFSPWQLFNGKLEYKVNTGEVIFKSGSLVKGDWVAQVGRYRVRAGEVNAMEAYIHWDNGLISKEIVIEELERGQSFAEPGDSGAMVINLKKEWVGMLHGRASQENFGFVTPTMELMDDIKAKTGGSISLA
ncbi:hypothetical protein OIDMADRAFT_174437 [Oidiodendron maius Zn]|uniref:Peptidase S1 domain-containing protein n=1 Tax=Oidiodendron maius (strain Zn) TaxID=913774 RepID=A0A0C3DZE0_OIDMZ|nr:hypothetical protein OIDMADRAFT_174437 [Oidiodendron maius Zn]